MSYQVLQEAQPLGFIDLSCCAYNYHEDWLDPLDEAFDEREL